MEHSGEPHVDGEPHPPGGPRGTVQARRRPADEREVGLGRPALDVVRLVDEHPDVLVPAFHLLLRADEAGRHRATGRAQDRALDLRVRTAAAEVAGHRLVDLLAGRLRHALEQRGRADDLARGAEPALQGVLGDERLLDRRGATGREPLDRHDLVTLGRLGEQQARVDGPAVDEHRARTAGALSARELRSRATRGRPGGRRAVGARAGSTTWRWPFTSRTIVTLRRTTRACPRASSGVESAGASNAAHPPARARPSRGRLRWLVERRRRHEHRRPATETTAAGDTTAGADGCTDVDVPPAREDGGATAPTERLDPEKTYDLVFETNCGSFTVTLDLETGTGDGCLARLAREVGLLRRHDLPPDRPRLRDPGRRPDAVGSRRPRLPDGRSAPGRTPPTRRASSRWRRPAPSRREPPAASSSSSPAPTSGLPPDYAIVGDVTSGIDIVERIGALGDADDGARRPAPS